MFEFLKKWRGKSTGGWNVLDGVMNRAFQYASSIWRQKSIPEMELTYEAQIVVYACVNAICRAIQEAPLSVGRLNEEDSFEKTQHHWAAELLRNPNPEMHGSEYLWHVAAHLTLTGTSYVYKRRNFLGMPAQLWPLPTSWVTPVRDRNTGDIVLYKLYQGAGRNKIEVAPRDVFRMILPNPSDLGCGLGPLQPAGRDVQMDDERADYFVEMIANRRQPGSVFYQPEGWSEPQKKEVRDLLKNGFGKGNRGLPFFLSGQGAKIEMLDAMKDLDWPGLSGLNETRICAAFSVPPIIAGLRSGLDAATYSNFKEAKRVFMNQTVTPLWGLISDGHTKGLLFDEQEDAGGVEVYADTRDVEALRESRDEIAKRAGELFKSCIIDRNEAREMVGRPLLKDSENGFLMPMGVEIVNAQTMAAPIKPDDGSTAQQAL